MSLIELAPNHKTGLALANPVMPAAGCFGLATEYAELVEMEALGAVVVGPLTARPRQGAQPPRQLPIPGGILVHTGLANPGVATVVRRYARAWARSPVPVIVHVAGTSPDETDACCRRLSGVEAVAGVELGLPDTATPDEVAAIVRAARTAAVQPLIVRLPLALGIYAVSPAAARSLCELVVEAGADALTVAAPPRGSIWHEPGEGFVSGRLYGPLVLPLALHTLRRVAELVTVPLIGCGGVHSVGDALAFLRAGAVAVQVDAALWRDPACLARIAREMAGIGDQGAGNPDS
jgi:dihydroorotate dehydrogenase (NAD+) catalytic subunit